MLSLMNIRSDPMKQCYLGLEIESWVVSDDDIKWRNAQFNSKYLVIKTPNKCQRTALADDDCLLTKPFGTYVNAIDIKMIIFQFKKVHLCSLFQSGGLSICQCVETTIRLLSSS